MYSDSKINRQPYTDLQKDEFGSFGTNVATTGTGNDTYKDQAEAITAVGNAANEYNLSLSAANTFGGKDRTLDLANARTLLQEKLYALVGLLEAAAPSKPDPAAFLTGLGFTLAKIPYRRTGIVKPPVIKSAVSGGKNAVRGKVKFVLKAEFPDEIKAIIGRNSEDGGLIWANGLVATNLICSFTGQPSGKDCLYQFKFIATNNRESEWCAVTSVSVF